MDRPPNYREDPHTIYTHIQNGSPENILQLTSAAWWWTVGGNEYLKETLVKNPGPSGKNFHRFWFYFWNTQCPEKSSDSSHVDEELMFLKVYKQ